MIQGKLFAQDRELLLGPAGCGKTHRILELYLAELEAGRESQVLLLVPTASFREHTRNTVLRRGRVQAFRGNSVATFDEPRSGAGGRGSGVGEELTGARRELLIRRLLHELDLPYFKNVASYSGFREALAEEAEEVLRAGLTAKELERRTKPSSRRDAFLKFLRLYESATADFRKTPEIQTDRRLLLVDGFTDFTAEQQRLLRTLVERAERAVVTLPYDGDVARSFLLRLGFRETVMDGNRRSSGSLAGLESALRAGEGGGGTPPLQDGAISTFTAADRRDEVDLAAREILSLVRDNGYRCQEIGVIVQNADGYLPLIRDLFPRYGIPVRLFFPMAVADTAMGRHLLACLDLFRTRDAAPREAVLAVLKSPYSPVLKQEAVERFEHRMMERRAQAERGEWQACLGTRPFPPLEKFFAGLQQWKKKREAAGARSWARWTVEMWEAFTLMREVSPRSAGPHAQALELRADARARARALELPAQIAEAGEAEGEALDFPSFAELLAAEMARVRFRVRDRRQDAVNVMNAYEARQWELKVVFVMGLVEKEFPRSVAPALFLEDGERQALGLVTTADRVREERRLFYVAATRARERLLLSHPHADGRGARLLQSFFLEDLRALLPESAKGGPKGPEVSGRPAPAPAPRENHLQWPAALARLREEQANFSASQFREFGQCPFKHFAAHVMKLEGPPGEVEGLTRSLEGTIVHDTLRQWETGGRGEAIAEVFERCFAAHTEGIPITHAEQKLRDEMRKDLERFVKFEEKHDQLYRTRPEPKMVEKTFGRGEGPILSWTLADGSSVQINGRLDRVETGETEGKRLGLVVDFKYSDKAFQARRFRKNVEEGQEFQIPLYLLALQEAFGLEPAGAELYTLRGEPRRRGVVNDELVKKVFRGQPPEGTERLSPQEFRELLETARRKMQEYAAAIREGEIAVRPHDTKQCQKGWCDFYDLCRVNKWEFSKS